MVRAFSRLTIPVALALASTVLITGCDDASEIVASSSTKSLDLELNDPTYYVNLGTELRASQKLEAAIAAYRKAIQIDFRNVQAYQGLGSTLYDQGRLEEAIATYGRAVQISVDNAEAYCGLGNALLEQKRPEEAIAAYHRAIQINPTLTHAYSGLGNALRELKKFSAAINAYQKALSLPEVKGTTASAHTIAYVGLGRSLHKQGKSEEAIALYRKAISLDSRYAVTYLYLGDTLFNQKRLEEASRTYRKALNLPNLKKPKLISSHALAHNGLGLVLQRQGKTHLAIGEYQQALKLDLSCEVAGENLRRAKRLLAKQPPKLKPQPKQKSKQTLEDVSNVSWVLLLRSLKTVGTARTTVD
ncbi:tetratricopeptide repeat protein [Phormidesmis priestleyi ULC007]|uniref:Tetratricopeptide repeat protein n=1 Tax=Phormidesmis priestleyi ULC007 TaxID=1920490 RepID=A0A2T1DF67_9CYAN|nr:tetratricopeptide repeat protein [Phormidesmis priestleyi ULC007]PZO46059.1 MAG: tetratricopeptide repeat protein [Phormidesmis priestleyi]